MRFEGKEYFRTEREDIEEDAPKFRERDGNKRKKVTHSDKDAFLKEFLNVLDIKHERYELDANMILERNYSNRIYRIDNSVYLNSSYNLNNKIFEKESEEERDKPTPKEARFNVNKEILNKIYFQLKEKNWSYPKIDEYIGADFKNIRHSGVSMTENSFNKLQELVGWEIPRSTAQKVISRNQNKIFVTIQELKSILDDLKSRGITHNDVSNRIGSSVLNAYHLGLGIPENQFEKLEILVGRKIPIREKVILKMNQKAKKNTNLGAKSELEEGREKNLVLKSDMSFTSIFDKQRDVKFIGGEECQIKVEQQKKINSKAGTAPDIGKEEEKSLNLVDDIQLDSKITKKILSKPSNDWNPKMRDFSPELKKIIYNFSGRPTKYRISPSSVHTELNVEYFEHIDTKEKAYWLGFLYADGCVYEDSRNGSLVLQLKIHKKDEHWLDKFVETINANKRSKRYEKNTVKIRVGNKKLCIDLIKHGLIPRKSNIIEFPDSNTLPNEKLALAFLLGFFDGDGIQNRNRLVSGSKIFLEQIKNVFKLDNKILKRNSHGKLEGRIIHGVYYEMSLGIRLFEKLMKNYKNSIRRKRRE